MSNENPLSNCRGKCSYDAENDKCETCGRTMEQIRNAYYSRNKVRP